jgi:general nucleoside transport system permease protein
MTGLRVERGLVAGAGGGRWLWIFLFRTYAGFCLAGGRAGPCGGALCRLFFAQGACGRRCCCQVGRRVWRVLWKWLGHWAAHALCASGYGFAAIIVAFVGRLHPVGIVLSAVLMSMFYIGGELAQSRMGLPKSITGVFQGLLLFALLACDTFVH